MLLVSFKERSVLGKFKELLEERYMVPSIRKINEPHSVVNVMFDNELFACRVWPWTDVVTDNWNLDSYIELTETMNATDQMAIVVLLSDLDITDIQYLDQSDYIKVYNEIVKITNQGGH